MRIARVLSLTLLLAAWPAAPGHAATIDFEGLPNFLSPGSAIPGITVSAEGGIADEATLALVTGSTFPPGSVATSGVALLANLYGAVLTITFDAPVAGLSVQTVGSLGVGSFGTITAEAFAGAVSLGTVASDPFAIGDSGAPEALLDFGALGGITSVVFSASSPGAATFAIDDLTVPEPAVGLLLLVAFFGLAPARRISRRPR